MIEFLDRVLPTNDGEVSKQFLRFLQKQGFTVKLSTKVTGAKATKTGVTLTCEPAKGGDSETVKADVVLVCIGRRPYTEGLGLESVGVKLDDRKRVVTDGHFKTTVDGIYAIGDVIAGPMLAHKAEDEGLAAAEIIAGKPGHVNYDAIPARGLYPARGRFRRQDRGRAQERRRQLQGRQVPDDGEQPRPHQPRSPTAS